MAWRSPVTIACGALLSAAAVYIGWQLPHVEVCSGDVCHMTLAIDWARIDWGIPPKRYACGVPHPRLGDPLIGPGDVCIVADGLGNVLERATYEELRTRKALRRIATLFVIAGVAFGTGVVTRRRQVRR